MHCSFTASLFVCASATLTDNYGWFHDLGLDFLQDTGDDQVHSPISVVDLPQDNIHSVPFRENTSLIPGVTAPPASAIGPRSFIQLIQLIAASPANVRKPEELLHEEAPYREKELSRLRTIFRSRTMRVDIARLIVQNLIKSAAKPYGNSFQFYRNVSVALKLKMSNYNGFYKKPTIIKIFTQYCIGMHNGIPDRIRCVPQIQIEDDFGDIVKMFVMPQHVWRAYISDQLRTGPVITRIIPDRWSVTIPEAALLDTI